VPVTCAPSTLAAALGAAPVEDDDAVGDVKGLLLVVRHDHGGDAHALDDVLHAAPHALPDLRPRAPPSGRARRAMLGCGAAHWRVHDTC